MPHKEDWENNRPAMSRGELKTLAEATYGAHWQSELAHDLSVARETVARWSIGSRHIQPYFAEKIRECCQWRLKHSVQYIRTVLRGGQLEKTKKDIAKLGLEDFA